MAASDTIGHVDVGGSDAYRLGTLPLGACLQFLSSLVDGVARLVPLCDVHRAHDHSLPVSAL